MVDDTPMMLDLDDASRSPASNASSAGAGANSTATRPQAQPGPSQGTSRGRPKRFEVRKWAAVALWAYDISVDNCAICRNHIMDKCIECQSIQEISDLAGTCNIAWGKCSHVFHMHCISRWLHTRQVCPLDNLTWELKKYGT